MISDVIIFWMEWIGTVSFAVSGALVAIGSGLDIFGVTTVGCITAMGGGVIRDCLIGNTPPKIFSSPAILLVGALTAILVFVVSYLHRNKFREIRHVTEQFNVFFDALGLAAFSITGVETVCQTLNEPNPLLTVTLGVITGVGGGILRDVLVNEKPYVLVRHIYAVVSILGCSFYYLLSVYLGYKVFATFFVLVFTVVMRLLAARYRWKLPKIRIEEE